jgi:hypothetical protein
VTSTVLLIGYTDVDDGQFTMSNAFSELLNTVKETIHGKTEHSSVALSNNTAEELTQWAVDV